MLRTVTAAALSIAVSSSAFAVDESNFLLKSAGDLAALCSAPSNPAAIHMCQGYLVGIHHMHEAVGQAMDVTVYCLPPDGSVTRDSAARDFAAWVNSTPSAAAMSPREGVLHWARQTYPCS